MNLYKEWIYICLIILFLSSCQHSSPKKVGDTSDSIPEFHVYSGRLIGIRYPLSVHTWIAFRNNSRNPFQVYHVVARIPGGDSSGIYSYHSYSPEQYWGSGAGESICFAYGVAAKKYIDQVMPLIQKYPFKSSYLSFPGPNSNTFISHLVKKISFKSCELPPNAIGKDFPVDLLPIDLTSSRTGVKVSILGLFGVIVGIKEGLEIFALGMNFGIDLIPPALKLPFIGRVGISDNFFGYKN